MMKKGILFGWAFVALASLSACTDNAGDLLAGESEIRLTSEITPSRVTSLDYQSTQIVPGQEVGITITGAKAAHKNVAWRVGEDGMLTNTGAPVFWANEDVVITAYHPYNSAWTSTSHEFSVSTDQSDNANYRNSDLLWAMTTSSMTKTAVPLVFDHKLAKVNVTLKSDDIDDLSGAVISICGTNVSTNFNPATGRLSATLTGVQEIKAGIATSSAYTASAIVVPQTVAHGTKFIKIVLGDRTFYYTLSTDKELRAGRSHNYTLTIKDKEVTTESDKITDWEDEDNEGDVEEELKSKYADGVAFVAKAGELPAIIPEAEKYTITSLKVSGELNGTDIKFIREMAGVNVDGNQNGDGKLVSLDLSRANIVEGGDPYYSNDYGAGTLVSEVNTIGKRMFEYARLNSLILPNTVTTIRDYAFAGSYVTTLNISEKVTNLETMALAAMFYLTEFTGELASASKRELIKDNTLVALAAAGLSGEYTVPQNITAIGDGAFAHLTQWCKLTSIVIPEGVTTIGNGAFWGSTVLQNITIPSSVKTIGYSAFGLCESLTGIVIPEGVTSIEQQTFIGCKGLTSFTIPNGVTNIGENAFGNCVNLSSISIPRSVISISSSAFDHCAITNIYIQDLSTYCEYDAYIFSGTNYDGKNCLYVNGNLVTNLVIPNDVTKICQGAFRYCKDITSVAISSKVKSIGGAAFEECIGIKSITIPNNVTEIGGSAFIRCENLEKVLLGNGVESIGNYCFYGCEKLDEIECHAINPPIVGTRAFGDFGMDKCYVPKGYKATYEDAGWHSYFWEIVEMN